MNRLSITTRLILSFVAIIFVSIILVIVVSNRVVFNRFSDLVARSGANFSRRVVPVLVRYYEANGSWDGIESLVFNMPGARESGMGRNRPDNMNPEFPGLGQRRMYGFFQVQLLQPLQYPYRQLLIPSLLFFVCCDPLTSPNRVQTQYLTWFG